MLDRKVHFPDDVGPLDSLTSSEEESDPDLVTPVVEPKLVVKETVVLSEDAAEALRRGVDAEEERDPQFSVGVPQDENDPPDRSVITNMHVLYKFPRTYKAKM